MTILSSVFCLLSSVFCLLSSGLIPLPRLGLLHSDPRHPREADFGGAVFHADCHHAGHNILEEEDVGDAAIDKTGAVIELLFGQPDQAEIAQGRPFLKRRHGGFDGNGLDQVAVLGATQLEELFIFGKMVEEIVHYIGKVIGVDQFFA